MIKAMIFAIYVVIFFTPHSLVYANDFEYTGTSGTDIMNCNRNGKSILNGLEGDDYYIVHVANDYECILKGNEMGKRYVSFNIAANSKENDDDNSDKDNKPTIIKLEGFSENDLLDLEDFSVDDVKSIKSSYDKKTDKKILLLSDLVSIYSDAKAINMLHKNSLGKIYYGSIGLNDNFSCDSKEDITIYSLSDNNVFNMQVPSQNNCVIYNNNDGNNIFKLTKKSKLDNKFDFTTKLYINNFKPGDIIDVSDLKIVSMDYIKFDTSADSPILQIGDQLTIFFPQFSLSCSSDKICQTAKDPNFIVNSVKL